MDRSTLKKSPLPVYLFFAVMTIVGLWTCRDYGMYWDGPIEISILLSNLKEYMLRLFGHESKITSLLDIPRISESVERDHGIAPYYFMIPVIWLLNMTDDPYHRIMTAWYAYTFLIFMGGAAALYAISIDLFSSKILACSSVLLMYLSPRMFAEAHYNNKDIVLMSLFLITIALGIRFIQHSGWQYGVLFSIAGAFSTNVKIVGIWAWGMVGIFYIIHLVSRKRFNKQAIMRGILAVLVFGLCYFLITPAMWPSPSAFFKHLISNAVDFSRWDSDILFQGVVFKHSVKPLPGYYLPWMFVLTTPVYVTLLILSGLLALVLDMIRKKKRVLKSDTRLLLLMIMSIGVIPLAYAVMAKTHVYNGWRHFYFLYGPLLILASVGMTAVRDVLAAWRCQKAGAALLAGCLTLSALGIIHNHPYEYAYYNFLAGRQVAAHYELDYWNVSVMNALEELPECRNRDASLALTISGVDFASDDGLSSGWTVLKENQKQLFTTVNYMNYLEANYLLVNPTYSLLSGWKPVDGYKKILSIGSYGHEIMTIYEKVP